MVFSSLLFLYAFFPLCLLACILFRDQRRQNRVLLIFSLIFYGWGGPKYLLLLMFMALVSWFCALKTEGAAEPGLRKLWVAGAAVIDIALIGWFKYAGFLFSFFGPVPPVIQKIVLPIGISFYTIQLLTYVVDVYRGEAAAQKSYWNVLLYAALFHQCIAGPIVRYKTIERELFLEPRKCQWCSGTLRFSTGLAKKVLLANPCGALADSLILSTDAISAAGQFSANLTALQNQSVLGCWVGILAYSLHIYLDFSAYSDMAIGMGRMLGLHYPENFNYPYISRSVTEFWRRWHISLGTFLRDYVYIPLGGNRGKRWKVIRNTFVVWALTGLWHGASLNYVAWGLWFFLLLMLERGGLKKLLSRVPVLSNIYLLLTVAIGWVIFRFTDLSLMAAFLRSLFGLNGNALTDFGSEILLQNNLYLLLFAALISTPVCPLIKTRLETRKAGQVLLYGILPVLLLLLSTACLVGNSYNPFLYFQF